MNNSFVINFNYLNYKEKIKIDSKINDASKVLRRDGFVILNNIVDSNLIENPMENVLINVCRNSAYSTDNTYFPLLRQVLQIVKMSKKYISAELAEKLCRNIGRDTWNKSQLILQFVADWWNMKNYKFTGAEMCYFGRYGDICTFREEIKSIPPPPPHSAPESRYRI